MSFLKWEELEIALVETQKVVGFCCWIFRNVVG